MKYRMSKLESPHSDQPSGQQTRTAMRNDKFEHKASYTDMLEVFIFREDLRSSVNRKAAIQ